MIVSRNWLRDYIPFDAAPAEVGERLTLAGLYSEWIEEVGDDVAMDLEVTSNRADWLGHLGIAREISVLYGSDFSMPSPEIAELTEQTDTVTSVTNECEDLCPQYVARVIRNVKVGPSPQWLIDRLQTVFRKKRKDGTFEVYKPVNNIVDITNYVLMECGQPLHAFDFDKLSGKQIVVRRGRPGEKLVAIDHQTYPLTAEMCVIADAERPVAIGGVMGGAETEITEATTNVLVEVANFSPLSVRATARSLKLHSPSSYRFERGINVRQMDWASRRCCELILKLAGGELYEEPVVAGTVPEWNPPSIELRFARVRKILGIDIPREECCRILTALGLPMMGKATDEKATFRPPSWRRDLTREIDLIEEVARVAGYDKIPENRPIPVVSRLRSAEEKTRDRACEFLNAAGFDEALTFSFTTDELAETFHRPGDPERLRIDKNAGHFGNSVRTTLIPSLIAARATNERKGNLDADLFEIARVFLGAAPEKPETQPIRIGLVSGRDLLGLKGVLTRLAQRLAPGAKVETRAIEHPQFVPGRGAELLLNGASWGLLGEIHRDAPALKPLKLREALTVAEVDFLQLVRSAQWVIEAQPLPEHHAIQRDFNFLLDDAVTWEQLEAAIRPVAGPLLERISFVEQYRGKHIPAGKKSYVLSLSLRSPDRTLQTEDVEPIAAAVIDACGKQLGATLR